MTVASAAWLRLWQEKTGVELERHPGLMIFRFGNPGTRKADFFVELPIRMTNDQKLRAWIIPGMPEIPLLIAQPRQRRRSWRSSVI